MAEAAAAAAPGRAGPLEVLVVAWYPAADDPISGRFIADQAEALHGTGRVRPTIVSFEPIPLHGDVALRTEAAEAWPPIVARAAGEGLAVAPRGAFGPDGVPVARLGLALGHSAGLGRTHQVDQRARALRALLSGSPAPPRLLHAHVGYPQGAAAATVARELGVPLVLTEHATFLDRLFADPDVRAAYLAGARTAARIVAVSRVLADRIVGEFPELADRLVVIPNAVDVDAFRPVSPDERDPDELLWVGYRREVKGMPTLLRAFAAVRAARPATTLRLVGRSPTDAEETEWRRLATELGVVDAVRFEPPADRAGVAAAMARAALFVHPSRRETMGVVAAEALAAGLPVVATDSGGVGEVLGPDPEAVGALVPPDEPEALAGAVLATLARRSSFDPARLRRHAVERFAAASIAARIADLYDELADGGAAEPRSPGIDLPARPLPGRVVLVGLDRPALDEALGRMPAFVRRDLVVVTAGDALDGHPDAVVVPAAGATAIRELIGWRGRARGRGLLGLLRAVPLWLLRRWRRRRAEQRARRAMESAIATALERATEGRPSPDPALVVCLGGIDVVAVAPFAAAGRAIVAPGGLRWLGDRRWAGQPPEASSA